MREVLIYAAVRTPFTPMGGPLRDTPAVDLTAAVLREAMARIDLDPQRVDAVLVGQAFPHGCGHAPSRTASLRVGIPSAACVSSLSRGCASGLSALTFGDMLLSSGHHQMLLAAGVESMSQVPYLLPGARWGARMGRAWALDPLLLDGGLKEPSDPLHPTLLTPGGWASVSHSRQQAADLAGVFQRERMMLSVTRGRRTLVVSRDEPDPALADSSGCPPGDGAAAILLATEPFARDLTPRARVVAWTETGVDPICPASALAALIRTTSARAACPMASFDQVEIHESTASLIPDLLMALPDLDPDRINPRGGALALGNPLGATGTRMVVSLLHRLEDEDKHLGLVALHTHDGQGLCLILERL